MHACMHAARRTPAMVQIERQNDYIPDRHPAAQRAPLWDGISYQKNFMIQSVYTMRLKRVLAPTDYVV